MSPSPTRHLLLILLLAVLFAGLVPFAGTNYRSLAESPEEAGESVERNALALPAPAVTPTIVEESAVSSAPESLVAAVREAAHPITGESGDYDALMERIGDARFVLLGEASHGTHEFYRERIRITQRLIEEKGFTAVAVEGDWPDVWQAHQYIRGRGEAGSAVEALATFTDFPVWMWRNSDIVGLVEWLREYNEALPAGSAPVGFYGLDLYSFLESADEVVAYLERVDPAAAQRARERYDCFEPYRDEPESYGAGVPSYAQNSCEAEALAQWEEMEQRASDTQGMSGEEREELFSALQNARIVRNAEGFYRAMHDWGASTWNLRDEHMAESLEALASYFAVDGEPARVVVWAHNSHVGDARATQMGRAGEWNIGQLTRERYPDETVLVGFTTYSGTVMAASSWGEAGEVHEVNPSLPESYGALFHDMGVDNFMLLMHEDDALSRSLAESRLERAIGVIYRPGSERQSHYFEAELSEQFDAVIHLDETRAVEPLTDED